MKFSYQQVTLAAIFILPLAGLAAWQGLRSETEADVPMNLTSDLQVAHTSVQRSTSKSGVNALRSPDPVDESQGSSSPSSNDLKGEAPRRDNSPDDGFCVLVTGSPEEGKSMGPLQVKIQRLKPELPTWSVEAPLVDGSALFGPLPEGTFRVVLFSTSKESIAQSEITWPSSEAGSDNRFEFDLDKIAAKSQENAAIATLRLIAGAQQQIQASSAIDTDGDGGGQYAFFGELAGTCPLRILGPNGGLAGGPTDKLNPPFLAGAFGEIQPGNGYGCVLRNGYYFRIHLPALSATGANSVAGVFESPQGGAGSDPVDPSFGELYWGAYAWPAQANRSPKSTFFINQEGDVLRLVVRDSSPYAGLNGGPAFDAAYSSENPGSMIAPLAIAAMGGTANDGGSWIQAGN